MGAALAGVALAPGSVLRGATAVAAPKGPERAGAAEPVQLLYNENTMGPSPRALEAMSREVARVHRYPFDKTPELIAQIARKEGVSPDHIVLGAGSGEVLEAFGVCLGRSGGEVIRAVPGYTQMTGAFDRVGGRTVEVPLNDRLEHDLDAMAAKIGPETKAIYVCNPNNPTGTIVAPARLRAFAVEAAKHATVFIDEAYLECSDDFSANTMVGLVREGHNVVVTRTFSKIYGLAGQRIGYGIMPPELAKSIRKFTTGSPNLLGVVAAQASLDDTGYVEPMRRRIKAERDALCALLKEHGRRYAEPQANFVFCHTGMPIEVFQERMLREGVAVARAFAPMLDWCRINVATPEEMAVTHAALRKVLG